MARWLDKKRRKRSGRYIVATRMRLAAPQAVADWLCEFAHLIDRGVRSETMTYEEAQDAKHR